MLGLLGAVTLLTGAIGVGTSILGMEKERRAGKKQDRINAEINVENQRQAAASLAAEQARKDQMLLDARRASRETIRKAQANRALAASRQVGAGTSAREGQQSTGFQGAQSQIAGDIGFGLGAINQNRQIGERLFQSSFDIFASQSRESTLQFQSNLAGRQIAEAKSMFQLGRDITASAPAVGREVQSIWET